MPIKDINAYMRERYAERRSFAIDYLGGACANCGATEALQFDHIDPALKEMKFDRMAWVSMARFMAELVKGQLLCGDCHSVKTVEENGMQMARGTHGTLSSYRYCKCNSCRAAKNEYTKEWKRRRVA
jgi:hypothetical protein